MGWKGTLNTLPCPPPPRAGTLSPQVTAVPLALTPSLSCVPSRCPLRARPPDLRLLPDPAAPGPVSPPDRAHPVLPQLPPAGAAGTARPPPRPPAPLPEVTAASPSVPGVCNSCYSRTVLKPWLGLLGPGVLIPLLPADIPGPAGVTLPWETRREAFGGRESSNHWGETSQKCLWCYHFDLCSLSKVLAGQHKPCLLLLFLYL